MARNAQDHLGAAALRALKAIPSITQAVFPVVGSILAMFSSVFNPVERIILSNARRHPTAAALVGLSIALLFVATIDRFESVKALGVAAVMKKLDVKVKEADELLAHIRELAILTASNAMKGLHGDARSLHSQMNEMRELMEPTGVADSKIAEVLRPASLHLAAMVASSICAAFSQEASQQALHFFNPRPVGEGPTQAEQLFHTNLMDLKVGLIRYNPASNLSFCRQIIERIEGSVLNETEVAKATVIRLEEFNTECSNLVDTGKFHDPEQWILICDPRPA